MINRRVVLVLGAGASNPYGFPLAGEMIQKAVAGEQNLVPRLTELGFHKPDVEVFLQEMLKSQLPSIDAFLEHRPEFLDVGKATLAFYVILREDENELLNLRNREHWYRYLYGLMKTIRLHEFSRNKLSIVTFNYDRSLEHYLATALMASHGKSLQDVLQVLNALPIVHVYGKLGELPGRGADGRPYNTELTPDSLEKAIGGIRIVSEGTDHTSRFAPAHHLIANADEVVFLGFGYHRENVSRLELGQHMPNSARLTGTVVGFTHAELVENVKPQFKGVPRDDLTENGQNVFDFLRGNLELFGLEH